MQAEDNKKEHSTISAGRCNIPCAQFANFVLIDAHVWQTDQAMTGAVGPVPVLSWALPPATPHGV